MTTGPHECLGNRTLIIKQNTHVLNFVTSHKCIMSVWSVDNLADMLDVAKRFSFQAILNATVSVDTFFLLRYVAFEISKVRCYC